MGRDNQKKSDSTVKQCFICCKDVTVSTSVKNPKSKRAQTRSKNSKHEGENNENCVKDHVTVIFFLRKFVGMPQEICNNILQEHGSPSSWISWCDCCSFYLEKAKAIFYDMELLQQKLETLREKLANDVNSSTTNVVEEDNGALKNKEADAPREIVRNFIREKYEGDRTEFPKVEVKLETHSDDEICEVAVSGSNEDFINENYDDDLTSERNEVSESDDEGLDEIPPSECDVSSDVRKTNNSKEITRISKERTRQNDLAVEEKVHECPVCHRNLSSKKGLAKHRLTHPPPCPYCNKIFTLKKEWQEHVLEHEEDELIVSECVVCGDALQDFKDVCKHVCVRIKPLSCSQCGMTFKREDVLNKHEMGHKGPKPYACSSCDKSFSNSFALKCHSYSHTGVKPYPCPSCTSGFSLACDLKRHIERMHIKEKSHVCATCGKAFSIYQDLKSHEKVHSGFRPFSCDKCDKRFLTMRRLRVHVRTHTGERPFACSMCEATFRDKTDLLKHEKRHSGERPHLCPLCGKSFATGFARHVQSHKHERPFSCSTCGKSFASARTAEDHKRIHTGEKPFVCSICDKKFRFEKLLRLHEKIHSGVKSHSCTICGKSFYYGKSLKVHQRTHSGQPMPYTCRFCGKGFIATNTLKEHERIHTGERPFSCSLCSKSFKRKSHLKIHKCQQGKQQKSSPEIILPD